MNEANQYSKNNINPNSQHSSELNKQAHQAPKLKEPSAFSRGISNKKMSMQRMRFYAFNIDLYCILIFHKLAIFSYIRFVNQSLPSNAYSIKQALLGSINQMYLSTFIFTYFSYFLISNYIGHGKTIGLTFFDLRAISHDREAVEPSFMESIMRSLGYSINYLMLFTPFVINLIRKDNKGLPDFFSQTKIMSEKEILHYQHSLKAKNNEIKALENISSAKITTLLNKEESEISIKTPRDHEIIQLDLFSKKDS